MPIFAWNVPFVSLIFLKRSLVFSILFFSSISLHWSLRKVFSPLLAVSGTLHSYGYIFPLLLCFLLLFFSQLFVMPSQTTMLPLFMGMFLITASCTVSGTSIHSSTGTLSNLIPWIYLSHPIIGIGFRLYLNGLVVFPTFFNLGMNLAIRSSWSEPQSAPVCVCADCIELLHLWQWREYSLGIILAGNPWIGLLMISLESINFSSTGT